MQTMYNGAINSIETTTTNSINATDTVINVLDESRIPEVPNLLVLGQGATAETVKLISKVGTALTVTRGFQGTAKAWAPGTIIARNFTEYDYRALKENIEAHDTQLAQDVLNLNTHTNNTTDAHGVNTKVSKTGDIMTDQLNIRKSDSSGFVALRLENSSIDANTTKFIENRFVGRDTANSSKDCVYVRVTPSNVNWLGANLEFFTRTNDANPNLKMRLATNGAIEFSSNNIGSPEGVVTAPVGSIYLRADGGANTTLYVKQSGTGNTGWVAK